LRRTGRGALAGALALAAVLSAAFAADRESPRRIVTLAPHLAELVCAAGACERLVGVVAYSDFPEAVARLPQVGDAFTVNAERLLALRPDLVLAWDGGTPREQQERLRALGLRVEPVRVQTLEEVAQALRRVGGWLGTRDAAERAAQEYLGRLDALRRAHARAAPLRVMYQMEVQPAFTVNRDSPISQAIALCGGQNVFAGLPRLSAPVGREAVIAADPEAIVFGRQENAAAIREFWARHPHVAAARRGALYAVDASLLARSTPRLVQGVEELCAALSDARKRRDRRVG